MSGEPASTPLRRQLQGRSAVLVPWLEDERVTDLLVNGTHSFWVERDGCLTEEPPPFADRAAIAELIERLLVPLGKRIDAASPWADGRLADGSRFHVILSPIAVEGPVVSIRRMRSAEAAPLEAFGPPEPIEWLRREVAEGRNVLVAGATGTGKTTLVTRLLEEAPPGERIVIVEESVEIRPRHPHVLHLEARPPSPDGTGAVTPRSLVRQALRMRPDRLVVGECRGGEALDLLQAMNTGHRGSLSTLHANGAADALRRLEGLALSAAPGLPPRVVREWIAASIHVVAQLERDGPRRRLREVIAVHGLEGEVYRLMPRWRLPAPERRGSGWSRS